MNFPDSVTQAFLRAEEAAANAGGRDVLPERLAVRLATPAVSIAAPREKGFELENFQAETGVADMLMAFMVRVEFDRDRAGHEADLIVDDLKPLGAALGNFSISANATAFQPRGRHATVAASIPLHTDR